MSNVFTKLTHEALNSLPASDKFVTLVITTSGVFMIVDSGPDEQFLKAAASARCWGPRGYDIVVDVEEAHSYIDGL